MKNIERYIQFAIDNELNGIYNLGKIVYLFNNNGIKIKGSTMFIEESSGIFCYPIIELITSKKFIEAVCSGIQEKLTNDCEIDILINSRFYDHKNFEKYLRDETDLLDDLTTEQAIAIRNNELGEFINNLLGDA